MLSVSFFFWMRAGSEGTSSLEQHEHNVGNLALEVVGQNWSSEVISVFLEGWEVGRVALSCHLSMDFLFCQDMRVAKRRSSESLGSTRSQCSGCQEGRRRCSDAQVPCFKVMLGVHAGLQFGTFCALFGMRIFFRCELLCFCVYQKVLKKGRYHLLRFF